MEKSGNQKQEIVDENVEVYIKSLKKSYKYFMTNDFSVLCEKLHSLGFISPRAQDFRWNPNLAQEVREKMAEIGAAYSLTFADRPKLLNFYLPSSNFPMIVFLDELRDYDSELSVENEIAGKIRSTNSTLKKMKAKRWPLLMHAVSRNSIEFAKELIAAGENVNFQDRNGITPLIIAVVRNNKEMVRLLIDSGADVNLMTKNGFNIIVYAILENENDNYTQIIEMLKNAGADMSNISFMPDNPKVKLSFHDTLNYFISKYTFGGVGKASTIYRNTQINGSGGLSKMTFSKIRSNQNPDYHPKKKTVFLFAIGMKLTIAQTETLLSSAGYFFDEKSEFDMILKDFISKRNFNMEEIEKTLYDKTEECLGNWGDD